MVTSGQLNSKRIGLKLQEQVGSALEVGSRVAEVILLSVPELVVKVAEGGQLISFDGGVVTLPSDSLAVCASTCAVRAASSRNDVAVLAE